MPVAFRTTVRIPWRSLLAVAFLLGASPSPLAADNDTRVQAVEPGQTAWSIAHAHGVRVEDLLEANGIQDPTELLAGREIAIPMPTTLPQRVAPPPDISSPDAQPQLRWPLRGHLTSVYGRRHRSLHSGLDIAALRGTIIVAAADGRVVRAGDNWGRYGRVVLLEHANGYQTLYAHTQRCFVRTGETVLAGQAIAAVGQTGNASGPHLHFEVWDGDRTTDPLRFLEPTGTDPDTLAQR